jgi:hypothetical protein
VRLGLCTNESLPFGCFPVMVRAVRAWPQLSSRTQDRNLDANIDRTLWGQLTLVEDYSSSEEEQEDNDEAEEDGDTQEGLETPSGIACVEIFCLLLLQPGFCSAI